MMGKFFVSFQREADKIDFMETMRLMNKHGLVVKAEKAVFEEKTAGILTRKHEGWWVSGDGICYSLLNHKYLSMNNVKEYAVFFYDPDLEMARRARRAEAQLA